MYKCQKVHLKFQVLIKVVISLTILSLNYLVYSIKIEVFVVKALVKQEKDMAT